MRRKPIETAANDAGLIAQTLQAAGFDVSGARDLDEGALRGSIRDFLEKARNVGPDGVAFVYFAGAGAQLEGDNYLLPVGAPIARDADIPLHGARLSDYLKPLASMGLKTAVIVLDAARALPFPIQGEPLAGGLALYEPGASLLLAFNAAPGTIAPPETRSLRRLCARLGRDDPRRRPADRAGLRPDAPARPRIDQGRANPLEFASRRHALPLLRAHVAGAVARRRRSGAAQQAHRAIFRSRTPSRRRSRATRCNPIRTS